MTREQRGAARRLCCHTLGVGTFISVGRSLETAVQRVERAEELGYESAYVTHIAGRDSLSVLAAYAARTDRIRLGTGVIPIYNRTPVAMAQTAATIDEWSGGRMTLGIGVSHRVTVENWYGQEIGKPVAEMREYVSVLRALLAGEEPPQGGKWPTAFRFMGYEPRADLPIYVSGLSPKMLQLAGEVADGTVLWLCNPDYVEQVVVPAVREGRERAGKSLDGFDIVAAVPSAVTDAPGKAFEKMRGDLVPYFHLPFYRAMLERSGFSADVEAGVASDDFMRTLMAVGSADEASATVRRYLDAGATSPCIGAVPGTDFNGTLEALAPLAASA